MTDDQQQPTASERIRAARDRDDHSAGRNLEALEQEAPHLIAPDVDTDLHSYAHELADAAINGAAGGYAETDEESDRRADLRDALEARLYAIARLETIRGELRAERVSYGELAELQSLAAHIEPDDVELLEAAGIPEHGDELEALEPADPRADVAKLTPAQLEQLATDHPHTAPAVAAELERRRLADPYDPTPEPERRPEPTTMGGETAHQLARRILNQDRKTRPAGDFEQDAEELARLVLVSDSLEELEQPE